MSKTIGEVCSRFSSGKSIKAHKIFDSGEYPVYGGNGLRGYTDEYNFEGECAVVGRQGAYCGNVRYFSGKAYMTEHAIVAVPNAEYDAYFLAYKFKLMNLSQYQGQSAQPGLSVNTLSKIEIELPDALIQKKIANVLQSIDNKITNNNKINTELESLAKMAYDYWFLQFEFPNENGEPYKSCGGKMVWSDELKREIPEGWEVKNIFDASDVCYGVPLSTELFDEQDGQPVIRIRDIIDNSISAYTKECVDEKFITQNKDLLIGMDGNFHMNFWYREGDVVNQRIVRIRDINNSVSALQIYFEIMPSIKAKEQNVARSTVGHLSDKDMKSLFILVSNNHQIYSFFNNVLSKICINKKESQELASLRDFLLPMLMNGQIGFQENKN